MLVAAVIGIAELLIALHDLPRAAREANETAARVIGAQLSVSLGRSLDEIDQLADSSLVWTALTDSQGRDVYLKPFLAERNESLGNSRLALLDYRGRFTAGDTALVDAGGEQVASLLSDVLDGGVTASALSAGAERRFWIAVPVIFPYTQDVIGVLLGAADTREIIAPHLLAELAERRVVLRGRDGKQVLHGDPKAPSHAPASYPIRYAGSDRLEELTLEVHSTTNPWLSGLIARGVEALCRWDDDERGEVPPQVFIPIAEETGAIHRLGLDLLRGACREMSGWRGAGNWFLSVNVSPVQLTAAFPAAVQRILKDTNWPASRLELEMTESSLMRMPKDAGQALDVLQGMGVRVVMDDFGSGHSSLCYLQRFRFDKLKIDLSVIRNLGVSDDDALMVSTIINLSHQLGLEVIAEGVETSAQQDRLVQYGCDMAQGYLYGKPMGSADLRAMLCLDDIA